MRATDTTCLWQHCERASRQLAYCDGLGHLRGRRYDECTEPGELQPAATARAFELEFRLIGACVQQVDGRVAMQQGIRDAHLVRPQEARINGAKALEEERGRMHDEATATAFLAGDAAGAAGAAAEHGRLLVVRTASKAYERDVVAR